MTALWRFRRRLVPILPLLRRSGAMDRLDAVDLSLGLERHERAPWHVVFERGCREQGLALPEVPA